MSGHCYLAHCNGAMGGQMLSCAAHWSFLDAELRQALIEVYDQLEVQRARGNLRRATRERWRELVMEAAEQWRQARDRLQAGMDAPIGASGRAWLYAQRKLDERAAEEAASA